MTSSPHHRLVLLSSIAALSMLTGATAFAADTIRVGQAKGVSIFQLPTYIAKDRGLFAKEGLDVRFVPGDSDREMTAAALGHKIDFVPALGGARVSIKGAPVRYIVGQSQVSPWLVVVNPDVVGSVDDLRGKSIALGLPGAADYEQPLAVLKKSFDLSEAADYKVASMPNETDRLTALIDGKVQGAVISWREVPRAGIANMEILFKAGPYLPRLEGAYWVTAAYLEEHPDTVRRFIRAIARATHYLETDQMGSIEVIQKRFNLESPAAANVLWHAVSHEFDPEIPPGLLRKSFEASLAQLRQKGLWPSDKPMPDVEQFIARDAMKTALDDMGY